VVLADEAKPPRRVVAMPIGKKAPPYRRVLLRWVVREVLRGEASRAGSTIEVDDAQWRRALKDHEQFHVSGLSKSPIRRRYDGPPVRARAILFLSDDGDGLSLVAEGALEDPKRRDEISTLLAR
jgi:hypothetical protein